MLKPGTYEAIAINSGISATMKGTPQAFMEFEIRQDGENEYITWFGALTEKGAEISVKALVAAGFVGNDFADLEKPFEVVFGPRKVSIEVVEESFNGKSVTKVKWVNAIRNGPKKFEGAVPKMAGLFTKVKQEAGMKRTATPAKPADETWG